MNKAELIDSIASEADLTSAEVKKALDAFMNTTTKALQEGNRVALVGFGSFSVSKRSKRGRGNGSAGESSVVFNACPEFAAALDLIPGKGDERHTGGNSRCHNAEVVIDAERIARESRRGRDSGLSKADAKKALDAFINTTTKELKKGDNVSLVGFGSFSISKRSARKGRNPQTGKEIKIPAKKVVKFKPSAELSQQAQRTGEKKDDEQTLGQSVSDSARREGKVKFFHEAKGFGFIHDNESGEEYFVHVTGLIDEIRDEDDVTFELREGRKGMNAVDVRRTD
jgi:nucleoid DNA-binding protein/cold shock CspA family protein